MGTSWFLEDYLAVAEYCGRCTDTYCIYVRDPAVTTGSYGVPNIDLDALASIWNVGTHQGSGGACTAHGTVTDVP